MPVVDAVTTPLDTNLVKEAAAELRRLKERIVQEVATRVEVDSQLTQAVDTIISTGSINVLSEAPTVVSVGALLAVNTAITTAVNVLNYHTNLEGGGGVFYWDANKAKSEHNGGTIIDPTVVFPTDWTNQTQLTTWFDTSNTGSGCWVRQDKSELNLRWFGAKGDGVSDDTKPTQKSLLLLKGDDDNGANKSATKLIIPMPMPGGTYLISDTLIVDGVHSCVIESEALLSQRNEPSTAHFVFTWNTVDQKPVFHVKGGAGAPSNPNFNVIFRNISVLGRAAQSTVAATEVALAGFYIGTLAGDTQASVNRGIIFDNCSVECARFGFFSGSAEVTNTDHAPITLNGCKGSYCYQHAVVTGSGNAIMNINSSFFAHNGYGALTYAPDSYSLQKGSNVYSTGGMCNIVNYISGGSEATKPYSADIYQEAGSINITNAWSDCVGYFLYQGGGQLNESGYAPSHLSNIRHYNSLFTEANTPDSMYIKIPGTVVNGASVYGNINVVSGASGRPVFAGISFYRSNATFTGTGVDTQRSLVLLGNNGNYGQILVGGTETNGLSHKGSLPPYFLASGSRVAGSSPSAAILQWTGARSGDSSGTLLVANATDGSLEFISNCYYTGISTLAVENSAVPCTRVLLGGSIGLALYTYDPNSGLTFSTSDWVAGTNLGRPYNVAGLRTQAPFKAPLLAGDPSPAVGAGSVYFNTTLNKLRVYDGTAWVSMH